MEQCGNLSNASATSAMPSPDLTALVIVFVIASVPLTIFNGLIAVLLLQATSVAIQVRVPLINLLVETLITGVALFCAFVISAALALSDATEPPQLFCQLTVWFYSATVVARLLGLLLFSVSMSQMVGCSRRKITAKWLMCSMVATWVIAILSSIDILVPGIHGFQYVGGVACYTAAGCPEYQVGRMIYSVLWLAFACFVPLLVCICVLLGTLCYMKRHNISEGAQYKKALAKFAAFLITGNFLNVLGAVRPGVVYIVQDVSAINRVGVHIAYITILLSYIPTPVLIALFMRPVWKRLRCLFCSKHQKDNETIPMQQAETPL